MRILLLLCCLVVASAHRAHAQTWLATPDLAGTQIAEVGFAHLRLPPGVWDLIGESHRGSGNNNSNGESELLLQTENGRIAALMVVSGNTGHLTGYRARWLVPSDCGRTAPDILIEEDRNVDNYNGRFDCMQLGVTHLQVNPESPLWREFDKRASDLGGLSNRSPFVIYHKSSEAGLDVLTVSILINGASPAFKQMVDIAVSHSKTAVTRDASGVDLLADWARAYRKTVADSLE